MPTTDGSALTDAGHQLTAAHGRTGGADSVAARGVHPPGPRPAARLGLAVASGKIISAAALSSFMRVMVVSMSGFDSEPIPAAFGRSLQEDRDFASNNGRIWFSRQTCAAVTRVCRSERA